MRAALTPDVPTLWAAMSMTCLLFGVVQLGAGLGKRRDTAMALWGIGNLAGFVGGALISLQGALPEWLSVASANASLTVFWAFIWAGERVFAGQPVRWPMVAVGPTVVFTAFLWIPPFPTDQVMRVHLASAVLAGYFVLSAVDGRRAQRREPLTSRRLLITLCVIAPIPTVVRAVGVQLHGAQSAVTTPTLATSVAMTVLYLMVISINVCLLMMGRERLANQLADAAMIDPLTGVLNRSGFLVLGQPLIAECAAGRRPCSVMMMDLDHFKTVNDDFGHSAGDRLLTEFATTTQNHLQSADLLARIGGEEFCAALPDTTEREAAEIADRLRSTFAGAVLRHEGVNLTGTVSIGVAELGHTDSLETAMRRADAALYAAKNGGRDRVVRSAQN